MSDVKVKKPMYKTVNFWVFVGMFLGIITGFILGEKSEVLKPIGDLFVKLIKMVVIPMVSCSIIVGAASLGNSKKAGRIGVGTVVYYLATTAAAVVLALVLGSLFKPGMGIDPAQVESMFDTGIQGKEIAGFWGTILAFIPDNPIASFASGDMTQILTFSLVFGIGVSSLKEEKKKPIIDTLNYIVEAFIFIVMKIMYVTPIGVFALMATSVGSFGFDILVLLLKLFMVYVLCLGIQCYGVYGLLVKCFSKLSVRKFYKSMLEPQSVSLATASSLATLPVLMRTVEDKLGVSKEASSFVLPLGATVNMDGNAIYFALAAVFFAQMFGMELTIGQHMAIVFAATLGSIGAAGVPGPGLITVTVLAAANIPVMAVPILFGVDRVFDMLRTTVNITGDASCAAVVEHYASKFDEEEKSKLDIAYLQ